MQKIYFLHPIIKHAMRRLFTFCLMLFLFACVREHGKKDVVIGLHTKDSLLRVLTYGLSQSQAGGADVFIAKQYNFCYYPVTGCVLTKELLDSINNENKKVYGALADKYGANWKGAYTRKVDSLLALFKQAKEIVGKEPLIQRLNRQHNNSLYYHVAPTDAANIFDVQAFSSDSDNFSTTFIVNLHTRKDKRVK